MKKIIWILAIILLIVFVVYMLVPREAKIISPIPEKEGVKVIYVTPTKSP